MKSAFILALAGSAVAAPSFGDFLDALFGGNQQQDRPSPSDFPDFPPIGTGSGVPFPFPTATGAPFPTGTSGVLPFPVPGQKKRNIKALHIDYQLAPTAAPVVKRRELKYRQADGAPLPSFSLLDPNDTPTATEPATEDPELPTDYPTAPGSGPTAPLPTDDFPLPTGDFPFPTGGGPGAPFPTDAPFPTGPAGTGFPGLPTTFGTVTRGPQPTAVPEEPEQEEGEEQYGNWWEEFIGNLFGGGKGY